MKFPRVPSEGLLRAMPAAERAKLGKAGMTAAEAQEAFENASERKLQGQIAQWLDLHRIYYESDRMDKRTSGKVGRADFRICVNGLWLSIEVKTAVGKLSEMQRKEALKLINSGGRFIIARSLETVSKHVQRLLVLANGLSKHDSFDYRLDL